MSDQPVPNAGELEADFRRACADAAFAHRASQLADDDTDEDHEAVTRPTEDVRVDAASRVPVPAFQPFEQGITRLTVVLKEVSARRDATTIQLDATKRCVPVCPCVVLRRVAMSSRTRTSVQGRECTGSGRAACLGDAGCESPGPVG